jgi:hypothetical protein
MTGKRHEPPVMQLGSAALMLVIAGGIYQVSHLPERVPLTLPWILLIGAFGLLVASALSVRSVENFAWRRFTTVGRWALLAYAVTAGMIEYVFIHNDTRGAPLLVLSLSIVVYWLTVPLLIAYTVARYVPND